MCSVNSKGRVFYYNGKVRVLPHSNCQEDFLIELYNFSRRSLLEFKSSGEDYSFIPLEIECIPQGEIYSEALGWLRNSIPAYVAEQDRLEAIQREEERLENLRLKEEERQIREQEKAKREREQPNERTRAELRWKQDRSLLAVSGALLFFLLIVVSITVETDKQNKIKANRRAAMARMEKSRKALYDRQRHEQKKRTAEIIAEIDKAREASLARQMNEQKKRIAEIAKGSDSYVESQKKDRSQLQWVPPPNIPFSNVCGRSNIDKLTRKSFYVCKNAVEIWLKQPIAEYSSIAFRECPRTNSYKFAQCVMNWQKSKTNKTVNSSGQVEEKIDSTKPLRFWRGEN